MKNLNLIERLLDDSHEKQSPQRFARYAAMLIMLLTLGVGQMWAGQGYNGESHVYLNVDGTTKYYKVSTESWSTGSSLPGTWGGELKSQTFNKVLNIQIKGGAVGGWTENGGNISGNLYYKVTNNTTTPSSGWTTVGGINANYTTKSGNNCFRYKNDYSVDVTPTTPGTYYLHIKITDGDSNNRTSYVKIVVPSFTVAGSSDVLGSNWSATDTDNDMAFSSGTTYTLTKSNVELSTGTTYECKVVLNHDWDAGSYPGSNKTFTVNANGHYNVTFSFNASNKAVDVSTTRLYAVIYNDNGKTSGSVPATSYHANGATVTVASNSGSLAKTGYSFGGWNTNSSGTGTNYTAGSGTFTMGSSDKNLFAKWTENMSTVSFVASPTGKGTFTVGGSTVTSTTAGVTTTRSVTAVPISGYHFVSWSITGSATISSTTTNPTTVTGGGAGTAATLTATFEADAVNSLTVSAGTHVTTVTGSTSPVTLGNKYAINATAFETGWQFLNWTASPAANGTFDNASSASTNVTVKNGSVVVTANAQEKMTTVTVNVSPAGTGTLTVGGAAFTPGNTTTAGVATSRTVVATAANDYAFSSWSVTDNATGTSSTNTYTLKGNGSAGTGTLTANFTPVPCKLYKLSAAKNGSTTDKGAMSYDPTEHAYYKDITTDASPYYFRFYYNNSAQYCTDWSSKAGGDAYTSGKQITANDTKVDCNQSVGGWTDKPAMYYSGESGTTIRIWFDYQNKKTWITADKDKQYVLRGANADDPSAAHGMPGWEATTSYFVGLASGNTGTVSCSLNAGEWYHLKVYDMYNKTWYGTSTSGAKELTDGTLSTMGSYDDFYFGTTVADSYTFTLDKSSGTKIKVDYPVSYQVQLEVGTVKGNKQTPGIYLGSYDPANKIESGSFVPAGSHVIFVVASSLENAAKTGYTWCGFFDNAAGSTPTQYTNNEVTTYHINPIAADAHVYACFYENDYTVTVNAGTGGKVNSLSSTTITGHVATLANLPTATADPGYYFVNWTTTAGTLTNSTSATTGKINGLTSTATVTANFAPIWTIAGLGGDWNTSKLPLATTYVDATVNYAYLNIDTLRPNTTYYFKAIQRSQGDPVWWRAENASDKEIKYTNSNTRLNMVNTTGDNFTLKTAGAGRYTFDVNLDGAKHPIKVHFPTSYTVTFGSAHGTVTATVEDATTITTGQYAAEGKDITFAQTPATGYTFDGWYDAESGGTAISCMASDNVYDDIAGNISVYAQYDPKEYTVTLTNSGTGYGSGGQANLTATYDAAFPSITLPTATNGYAFMGYWSAANGEGTQFTNASGVLLANITDYSDESGHWKYDASDLTLYAYYKKAEITEITLNQSIFEPVASGTSYVKAEPTIEPTPVAPTKICWELLYDNDNPVTSHVAEDDSEVGHENRVKFNLAGLAAGSYRIRATLYTGTECSGGTLLSTYDKTVTIANEFTVTVKYMCGTEEIKASTTTPGKATEWTSIDAPDIFGYTFSTWDLGDGGITKHESDALTKKTGFRFKASYNGTLTAKYNKNKYIYLDLSQTFGSGKWSNPYCYLYNSDGYWDNTQGAGATGGNCVKKGAMTQITGTDIWYFDYSDASAFIAAGNNGKLAFTWGNHMTEANFGNVDAIYRTDFSEGTPLFIPAVGQNKEDKSTTCCGTGHYYNRGYWTNYTGSKTGYTLLIYNSSGTGDPIKTRLFTSTSNDMRMTMKATVDLEAATTYKVEILRDNGHYYKNSDERNYGNSQVNKKYLESGTKGNIVTTAAGDYVFTLSYTDNSSDKDFQIRMIVDYPAAVNDFQVMYNDNATWSLGTAHTEGWRHPSRMIKARAGGVDTISFFVGKTNSPKLYARKVTNASSLTWASLNIAGAASMSLSVDSSAVYNFKVTQSTAGVIASIENIGAYTGEYYIRCDAVNSKWDNYTTDDDHRMTYSSFSESDANAFGEKYSHYKAKWCKYGKNVKFVIANDYSPCISDTLVQDVPDTYENINEDGFLKDDGTAEETKNRYSANIRFMWNRKTNKISRAYVASSTNASRLFLVLRGNTAIKGLDDSPIEEEGSDIPSVILQDDQNWIYEEVLYIKPNTRFKLYACYAQVTASPNGAQYFRGTYNGNAFSGEDGKDSENSVVLIGGSGETYQKARVLYDFKTNRLICAWLPSSSAIDEEIGINADVMVIREHHEPAQYISFKDEDSKLTGVKTVYGVMKFNRWVLNNRKQTGTHGPLDVGDQKSIYERSLYFVSFPFDVRVGDIFGFGRYWDEWYLEYYDGLNRAKNGYWEDSPPNWKYVTPEMATDYVLKANVGYILGLDLDFMAYDNTTFWAHDIETIELFFPSTVAQETLQQVNCTIPALSAIEGDPYRCTINRGTTEGDRRVKDSYWRCLGVPSFNIYNTSLKDASGTAITWQPSGNTLPFIYMWNKADNTLTPQSTSTFTFLPMHAYLVQNGGEIRWENVSAKGPSSIVARRVNEQPATEYEWRLALMSDSILIDQTYVKMSNIEQVTDTFDFNQDMIKEFNAYRSDIYTYIGYERVAANSMPLQTEQTTVIPVGVKIKTAGEYTFAMPDGTNGVGVTLVDTQTGVRTNLGLMDYTVTLTAGSFNQRFVLEISPIMQTPTDIEEVTGDGLQVTGVRKVLIDQKMYIIRDGKVYDARGAKVK